MEIWAPGQLLEKLTFTTALGDICEDGDNGDAADGISLGIGQNVGYNIR